jgi:aryl-alcohol dehydrogenase-like predicted oxidoreductase
MRATLDIERRRLGRSDVTVPRVALGCGSFGGVGSAPGLFGQGLTEPQAHDLMDAAWELGITHFDTADAYGGGRSEQMIGSWISSRNQRPQITTKTFNPMREGADRGLAPERIERQLHRSLGRLGVDHVDVYLAHDYDPDVPLVESFEAFERLANAGAIRAFGVSNFDAAQFEEAIAAREPDAVQNSHSLLDRKDDDTVLPLCDRLEIGYLAFGPLCGGWLTGKYRRDAPYPPGSRMTQRPGPYERLVNEHTFDLLAGLEATAAERGTSMAALALAWLLADDRVTQIVVGPGRPEHLAPIQEALACPLTAQERARICASAS